MKTLNIPMEDNEYKKLKEKKEHWKMSWHDFVMILTNLQEDERRE